MTGVIWPVVPRERARIDAKFLDPGYPSLRRSLGLPPDEHPGVDINISGTAGNADLGWPVVAIGEGEVVHVGKHRVWGNVVLVRHPTYRPLLGLDHEVYSQYAHLHQVCVSVGDYVYPGYPVGSIGTGDPAKPFLAHLHFEIRKVGPDILPADAWPKTRDKILKYYLDPVEFLSRYYKPMTISSKGASVFYDGTMLGIDGEVIVNFSNRNRVFVRKV